MKTIIGSILVGLGLLTATLIRAQETTNTDWTTASDLQVMLQAVEQIPPIPAEDATNGNTFYSAQHAPGTTDPWPPLPGDVPGLSVWGLGDGSYLLDDIGYNYHHRHSASSITLSTSSGAMVMAADVSPVLPGDDEDTNSTDFPMLTGIIPFDTNELWLQITNVVSGIANLNLYNATDYVYAVWSTTNLLTPFVDWQVETEVFPSNTNCMPFMVQTQGRTNLFLNAEDWTGITENGNTTPEWWFWLYYGTIDLSDTNRDSQGYTLLFDYTNRLDPNVIEFSVSVTNNYVNSSMVPVQLDVTEGVPDYIALVDSTNFTVTNGTWYPYVSSNIVVDLASIEGQHDLWIGLKGLPTNATVTWQEVTLTLQTNAPVIVVTNPISGTVSDPLIQVQGYANESLSSLTYDVSNAAGWFTDQTGSLTGQYFDTNLLATTLNYFQLYDVPLTNGLNTVRIHATDLAGNTTVTNFSFTLDYSTVTNLPALNIVWPQNGTAISGTNFTLHAQVDDALDTVTATIADSSGDTNVVTVPAQRNGNVWAGGLPMAAGTNILTVTAINPAGLSVTTNLTLVQSSVMVTMDPLSSDQNNQTSVNVTGTISSTNDSLTVNGVLATIDSTNETWSASSVPVSPVGVAVFDLEVWEGDPVNIGSQQIPVLQPPTVNVSAYVYDDDYWQNESLTDTEVGTNEITQDCWQADTSNLWWVWATGAGGHQGFSDWSPDGICADAPTWDGASRGYTYGDDIWGYVNYTESGISYGWPWTESVYSQTTVTVDTGGEGQPGTTQKYLVMAEAKDYYYSDGDHLPPPDALTIRGQTLQDSEVVDDYGGDWGYIRSGRKGLP